MLPIVLAHGIVATDRLPPEFFWGRIPETLRKSGFSVFFGGTDAVGTYQTNAAQLFETVKRVCEQTSRAKVIVLAHSKGGIDSRYCLSQYDKGRHIAALVTMCTPHLGSEVADSIIEHLPEASAAKLLSRTLGKFFPDRQPEPLEAIRGMTTANLTRFNSEVANVPGVFYRSYYTTLKGAWDDLSLSAAYRWLNAKAGPNDGVVSAASAQWGDHPEEIRGVSGGISHWEVLDLKRRKISGLFIPDLWVDLARSTASVL